MAVKIYASLNRQGMPPMTIEKKNIDLVCYLDSKRISRAIAAYICGGLALHESLSGGGRTITHIKDGVYIYQHIHQSMNYLRPILQEMAALTNWDRPYHEVADDLVGNQELKEKYRALLERLAPGKEPSVLHRKY